MCCRVCAIFLYLDRRSSKFSAITWHANVTLLFNFQLAAFDPREHLHGTWSGDENWCSLQQLAIISHTPSLAGSLAHTASQIYLIWPPFRAPVIHANSAASRSGYIYFWARTCRKRLGNLHALFFSGRRACECVSSHPNLIKTEPTRTHTHTAHWDAGLIVFVAPARCY